MKEAAELRTAIQICWIAVLATWKNSVAILEMQLPAVVPSITRS